MVLDCTFILYQIIILCLMYIRSIDWKPDSHQLYIIGYADRYRNKFPLPFHRLSRYISHVINCFHETWHYCGKVCNKMLGPGSISRHFQHCAVSDDGYTRFKRVLKWNVCISDILSTILFGVLFSLWCITCCLTMASAQHTRKPQCRGCGLIRRYTVSTFVSDGPYKSW